MDLIVNIRVPVEKDGDNKYVDSVSEKLGIPKSEVKIKKILSKSLDARNSSQFFYEISLIVTVEKNGLNKVYQPYIEQEVETKKIKKTNSRPIIIGLGPAGLFLAVSLVDNGIKPVIFERGKKIEERHQDISTFIKSRKLNLDSNIQFGEGGAGSYSDGKLFSRIKNSEYANNVLKMFIRFGAPAEIEYISKPHLGTDVLCKIVKKMREHILSLGGEINYNSKLTDIIIKNDSATAVVINDSKEYVSTHIFLAIGHSARDTFELINQKKILIEQKPISVGVRIEHPAEIINLIRYGNKYKDYKQIGSATYSFTFNNKKTKRGVYTFCMCPGGEIVNASSENGMLAINGMSYSKRSSPFSNSAIVVTCDVDSYKSKAPLAGILFQREIEKKSFELGGGDYSSPAQNLLDYLSNKESTKLNESSFKMGMRSSNLHDIFPNFINEELINAFKSWKKNYPLFVSENAVLLASETRTSSPIRITRNDNFESVSTKNIYPIGEGSGYSGGITSSAVDALKAFDACFCD